MNILHPHMVATVALLMAMTYLIAGIPFGKIIAQGLGVDITRVGSKNIGSTNVARVLGKQAAAATLTLDAAKGYLSLFVSYRILSEVLHMPMDAFLPTGQYAAITGLFFLAAVLGHIFSVYLGFKGGKGIAVSIGACLSFSPTLALILLLIWLIILIPTKLISLASVVSACAFPCITALLYSPVNAAFEASCCISALAVLFAHRSNIVRLFNGREQRFKFAQGKQFIKRQDR